MTDFSHFTIQEMLDEIRGQETAIQDELEYTRKLVDALERRLEGT